MTFTREQCFEQLRQGKPVKSDGWLGRLRHHAQASVESLNFPSQQHDDWRLTDISPLFQHAFQPVASYGTVTKEDIEAFMLPGSIRLVFVDGSYHSSLSDITLANGSVIAGPLTERLGDVQVETHFARQMDLSVDAFAALNTSQFDDGAWVEVTGDLAVPVHILNITTQRDTPSAIYPRSLVLLKSNSRATVIEDYVGLGEGITFSNAVTEIVLQEHAQLQHVRVQREARSAFHFGHCTVAAGRGSVYTSTSLAFGARVSRLEMHVALQGECAEATLDGLALISGRQIADTHTLIDHAVPRCKSRQLHKSIADGSAHAVFSGKIIVRPGATGTDSAQTSRNLLLSGKAHIDTQPQLEIFNNDVSCKHGATIGQIDDDAMFFLKSRGLDEVMARNLLTHAFAAEIIARIPVPALAESLSRTMLKDNA